MANKKCKKKTVKPAPRKVGKKENRQKFARKGK